MTAPTKAAAPANRATGAAPKARTETIRAGGMTVRLPRRPDPTPEQAEAIATIIAAAQRGGVDASMLDGIGAVLSIVAIVGAPRSADDARFVMTEARRGRIVDNPGTRAGMRAAIAAIRTDK